MGLKDEKDTLCIVGGEFEDIVLYIIRIFECYGKKVVVYDHTNGHRFYADVPHISGICPDMSVLDYRGVGYAFAGCKAEPGLWKDVEADMYIRLYDIGSFTEKGIPAVFVADERESYLDKLENIESGCPNIIVIRQYTGLESKRLEEIAAKLESEAVYVLPMNPADHRCFILASNNEIYRFKRISKELKRLLYNIVVFFEKDPDTGLLNRACNRAAKGARG